MGYGSSSSAVIMNLDRPDPFYFAGEVISGVVQFNVNDETVEVDELVLKLVIRHDTEVVGQLIHNIMQ
ncbi:unnamed protein product [Adineta steineri]|uniref:Uncharacterized protein n=1 Tax=Adineta steineri TaxID=433720 RepID=A0A820NMZ5_9BILA|nr:unnamed protein product [Adineta steineri]CAF4389137.1 unnamed protein product [Adineta steineri]